MSKISAIKSIAGMEKMGYNASQYFMSGKCLSNQSEIRSLLKENQVDMEGTQGIKAKHFISADA